MNLDSKRIRNPNEISTQHTFSFINIDKPGVSKHFPNYNIKATNNVTETPIENTGTKK